MLWLCVAIRESFQLGLMRWGPGEKDVPEKLESKFQRKFQNLKASIFTRRRLVKMCFLLPQQQILYLTGFSLIDLISQFFSESQLSEICPRFPSIAYH